jgi:hypothetical protein
MAQKRESLECHFRRRQAVINDIVRYIKIKRLSRGQGHPESVPIRGSKAYPQRAGRGVADGTADFDSASRGGPAPSKAQTDT